MSTEHGDTPTPEQVRRDVMTRLAATEQEAARLHVQIMRLERELAMTREQLDMTRERLHSALMRNGDFK